MKFYLKLILILFPCVVFAATHFEDNAPPSLADRLHGSHHKDPIDGGWLPDITGLPENFDELTRYVDKIMAEDKDPKCVAIDSRLRKMMFLHFLVYQHMLNRQHIYFDPSIAKEWAHVFAMLLKESSGDSTNITDMYGHSISTYQPQTNLGQWNKILTLSEQTRVQLNYQTNFGLTQSSADRLFAAFNLAKNTQYNTEFLEGQEGAATPRKIKLNTAIAIRRLIWFYQDFAQGRISESDKRIHEEDIDKPEFSERYKMGLERALMYCGTRFMFREGYLGDAEIDRLKKAVASIAYCKLGNSQKGYGLQEMDEKCFAEWVTLCPALNIDIATLTPPSYFATWAEAPVCGTTFKHLIHKKPQATMPEQMPSQEQFQGPFEHWIIKPLMKLLQSPT